MKFILLHDAKNDDGVRAFFMDVWELYIKVTSYLVPAFALCTDSDIQGSFESIPYGALNDKELGFRCTGTCEC